MKTFFRFQYNDGSISMIVNDDREYFNQCVKLLTGKNKYPVAIWIITINDAA